MNAWCRYVPRAFADTLLSCAVLVFAGTAHAQNRPSETDMFGTRAPEQPTTAAPPAPGPAASEPDPQGTLTLPADKLPTFGNDTATADPITIGGQLYLRAQATALLNQQAEDYALSVPSLLDLYIDARPNERVRGFALARMSYDPK